MTKMVVCPRCKGRGMIGLAVPVCPNGKGIMFVDFECGFCKGLCWVSKKRAEKYEKEKTKKENKKAEETD